MSKRAENLGLLLARLVRMIRNHHRPIAGHDLQILRGSPIKGTGDYGGGP